MKQSYETFNSDKCIDIIMFEKFKWNVKLVMAVVTGVASVSALAYIGHVGIVFGSH
jgi:hypothetical protein